MEGYIKYEIPTFRIQFQYPEWWDDKIEDNDSYLFWDEYTGSFRVTPSTIDSPTFSVDQFLQNRFQECAKKNPRWRTYNNRKYLYYEDFSKDYNGSTILHFYISGQKNILLTCTFAYAKELLEDEYSRDEVEGALEEVDNVLDSLTM